MRNEIALIAGNVEPARMPIFVITVEAIKAKETALASSALIGRVSNQAENDAAVHAMASLKKLSDGFERERKKLGEPLLEAQRALKRVTDTERDELDRERGRLECLVKDFVLDEQRRVREEQEAQQRELDRIAREAQAALAGATNESETRLILENAETASRIAGKPVEITRTVGQANRKVWKITQINDFQLLKARPDLVRKIEWDVVGIKEILNAGGTLPGVTAEEDLKISVRAPRERAAIEI